MITDRRVADPLLRASLVVEAALAAALDAPTPVRVVLAAAAFLAVAGSAVRSRHRGRLDATVIALAGTVAALVLLGLVVNLFPPGLTRVSWSVGAGVLALLVVAWGSRSTPVQPLFLPSPSSTLLRQVPWAAAAVGVGVVAVLISVRATDVADRAPVQLSLTGSTAASVGVRVTASRTSGEYQFVVLDGQAELVRSVPFRLVAGRYVDYRFALPAERVTVDLRKVGSTGATRSLVVDPASGVTR